MTHLVVGLGNPGPRYVRTRHNAGFLAIDLLGENLGASYWKDEAGARTAVVRVGGADVVLAEPQTFMNLSGTSVKKLVSAYEVQMRDVIVVHDDIDVPDGLVRAKAGGGHGGHNGLRSLIEHLGGNDFARVRVGVGRPPGRMDAADYVLEPLSKAAWERLESAIPHAAQCVMHILEQGIQSAMREYNAD